MKENFILFTISGAAAVSFAYTSASIWPFSLAACLLFITVRLKNLKLLVSLLFVFILFFVRTEWAIHQNVSHLSGNEEVVIGTIYDGPYQDGNQAQFEWRTEKNEKLLVTMTLNEYRDLQLLSTLSPGMACKAEGQLTSPRSAVNFHLFHYKNYLNTKHIHWIYKITSVDQMTCVDRQKVQLIPQVKKWRHIGIRWIDDYFPDSLKGLTGALIFGDRHMLSSETEQAYQKLGLIHLLAVSGLHVGVISGAIYFLLLRLGITRENTEWVLLVFLPLYILLAGAAPSVIRAASIVWLILVLKKCKIKIAPLELLQLLALIVLFLEPYVLLHIGFQLSFLISASLLLSWPIFKQVHVVMQTLAVTFIAQMSAFPVLLYHFHEFSFLGILLNLLFIPFIVMIVLPTVFFLFFMSLIWPEGVHMISRPLVFLVETAHQLLHIASTWNLLHLVFGKPSSVIVFLLSLGMFCVFYCLERYGFQKKSVIPSILAAIVVGVQIMIPYADSNGYVTLLDVGQGDSILIELPNREAVYLIDGGGAVNHFEENWKKRNNPYDPGERVVVPFLKARGIRTIDKLIVTHGDVDHYNGLFEVVHELQVKEVLYGKGNTFKEGEIEFLKFIHDRHIPIQFVGSGDYWKQGDDALFSILWPEGGEEPGNYRSVVIWAFFGNISWLFTGDLEEEGENELLRKYPYLDIDILKAGHHGSRTSTTKAFVEQISPKAALISAGKCNRFGHPHPETVQTLEENNIKIYRTDEDGAIQITFQDQLQNIEKAARSLPIEPCK